MLKQWLISGAVSVCLGLAAVRAPAGVISQPFTVTIKAGNPASPRVYQNSFTFAPVDIRAYSQSSNGSSPVIGPSGTLGFLLGTRDQQHPDPSGSGGVDILDFNLMRTGRGTIPGFGPNHRTITLQFGPFAFGPQPNGSATQVIGVGAPYVRIDSMSEHPYLLLDPRPQGLNHQPVDTGLATFTPARFGTDSVGGQFTITLPPGIASWDRVRTIDLAFAAGLAGSPVSGQGTTPEPATFLIWGGLLGMAGLVRKRKS